MKELSLKTEFKTLLKHSSVYGLSNILQRVVGFLMIPVYTRFLTPADYGVLEIFTILTNFLVIFLSVGVSQALFRFYYEYENQRERNKVVSSVLILIMVISGVGLGILFLISQDLSELLFKNSNFKNLFFIAFGALFFEIGLSIFFDYLRVIKKSFLYLILSVVKLSIALSLNIIFVVILKLSVEGILLSSLITGGIFYIILIPSLFLKIGFHFSYSKAKEIIKFSWPLLLSNLSGRIASVSDRFILNEFVGLGATGIYSLGFKFGSIINNFITSPFIQIWNARKFEINKNVNAYEIYRKIFTYFTIAIVTFGLIISVISKELVMIIATEKFYAASKIIPLIVLTFIIFSFQYHLNIEILIRKKTKYLAYINTSNAFFNIILNLIFIPKYGIWGAVITGLITKLYKIIGILIINKKFNTSLVDKRIPVFLIYSIMMYFLISPIHIANIYSDLVIKVILALGLPLYLLPTRFYKRNELDELKKLIHKIVPARG